MTDSVSSEFAVCGRILRGAGSFLGGDNTVGVLVGENVINDDEAVGFAANGSTTVHQMCINSGLMKQ